MGNFEPWQSPSRQRNTRRGMVVVAVVILLTLGAMAALLLWSVRVQRPAQVAQATRRATEQSTPQPAQQPTATLPPLYTLDELTRGINDSFDDNSAGWPESTQRGDQTWDVAIEDGAYVWELDSLTNYVLRYSPESVGRLEDFAVSIDVDQVAGDPASYGLIFRSNDKRYYQFEIRETGSYMVFVAFSDTRRGPRVNWTSSAIIDRDGPNRLMVIGKADSFEFYINDTLVAQDRHGTFRDGRVGLSVSVSAANDDVRVEFDNFQLYVPDPEDK